MPFGPKNADATYQRVVNQMFKPLICSVLEVYVDDMLVKGKQSSNHVADLESVFNILRENGMNLNPTKCTFGVRSGKFLGYMIFQRGIEANPEKISVVEKMEAPKTVKEVQRLAGPIAALGRFVARAAEKCLPFFKILKHIDKFEWTAECQLAFKHLKKYLCSLPLLSVPKVGEMLYIYLRVAEMVISATLLREEDNIQKSIYYISHALKGAELRYPVPEKTAYVVVMTVRKLRPYFQSHAVTVLTDQPLMQILHKPESSGRLLKWTIELSEYEIYYAPRKAIKGQAVADFVVECSHPIRRSRAALQHLTGLYMWMVFHASMVREQELFS